MSTNGAQHITDVIDKVFFSYLCAECVIVWKQVKSADRNSSI
jgi:hypothetical protein